MIWVALAADRLDIQSDRAVSQVQNDDRSLDSGKGLHQHGAIDRLRQLRCILAEIVTNHVRCSGAQQVRETVVYRDDARESQRKRLPLQDCLTNLFRCRMRTRVWRIQASHHRIMHSKT